MIAVTRCHTSSVDHHFPGSAIRSFRNENLSTAVKVASVPVFLHEAKLQCIVISLLLGVDFLDVSQTVPALQLQHDIIHTLWILHPPSRQVCKVQL